MQSSFVFLTIVSMASERMPNAFPAGSALLLRSSNEFEPMVRETGLKGWHAVPDDVLSDWSAQDGTILGIAQEDRLSYLVWNQPVSNFVMRFQYRMLTRGNTGVEIRAKTDTTGKRPFEGYHADLGHVGIGPQVLGAWDFHFAVRREPPCPRGTRLVIKENGRIESTQISDAVSADDICKRNWNRVRLIANGNRLRFFINGKLSSEVIDQQPQERLLRGFIGLQLHDKGMRVQFKDLEIKQL
ncbi:MAG: DUF1080 domain-containing protein [Planctomycetes bacterium]|nr:DUF1080 domain-containing protein [Planctomycetota bacterium]